MGCVSIYLCCLTVFISVNGECVCVCVRVSAHGHMHYRHVLPHLAFYMGVTEVGVIPTEVLMPLQVALSLLSQLLQQCFIICIVQGFFFF